MIRRIVGKYGQGRCWTLIQDFSFIRKRWIRLGGTGWDRLTIHSCSSLARSYAHALADSPQSVHSAAVGGAIQATGTEREHTRDIISSCSFVLGLTCLTLSKYTKVAAHKSRSFPVTSLTRATGAGPTPSTVAIPCEFSVNSLWPSSVSGAPSQFLVRPTCL